MARRYRVKHKLSIPDDAWGLDGTFDPDEVVHLYALSQPIEVKGAQQWQVDLFDSLEPDATLFGSIIIKEQLEYVGNALAIAQEWVQNECGKNKWKMRIFMTGYTEDCRAPDRQPWTTAYAVISR